ncbi:hypothetical protein ASD97_24575 [Streptomyces sp. Root63]|uniref:hypothetical protein n=1 Tax=unclassified Streptomyces TaxID=2593676 RepID=UPI0006FACDE7|nr:MULTISPECIES: hypothetical protein [unclassified Streptomyces]KQX27481.1 hypothetical protein ASD29_29805 [Streptomyces sp. Root1295]KRA34721.1 hypothetical protein ASD97_24575 [Streptomyces sp. Root63]
MNARTRLEADKRKGQKQADEFNALHPVGTPVLAYPGVRPEDGVDDVLFTHTRTEVQVSACGDLVLWVDGHGAYINFTHVDPVTEGQWHQAQTDHDEATKARRAALLGEIRAYPSRWTPERAAFAMRRLGFKGFSERTARRDLEALVADGHLAPVTEVVVRHYDLTGGAS